MPITINGTGSITGLSAGGLPDLSVATADLADGAVTAPKLDGGQTGAAPAYAARAWVNFNGTGTVAIRASGNVPVVNDNGVGDYTVTFTTAMPDVNYCPVVTAHASAGGTMIIENVSQTTTAFRFRTYFNGAVADYNVVCVAIFR